VSNSPIPQYGSFTSTTTGVTTPFTGNAVVHSYQLNVSNQLAFMPYVGRSVDRSFVYFGGGPTLSEMQTKMNGMVGFADINGTHGDISGAPVDYSSSGWVFGGGFTIGGTYFLDSNWFLDASYTFSATAAQGGTTSPRSA
jgi:hypothetical protein